MSILASAVSSHQVSAGQSVCSDAACSSSDYIITSCASSSTTPDTTAPPAFRDPRGRSVRDEPPARNMTLSFSDPGKESGKLLDMNQPGDVDHKRQSGDDSDRANLKCGGSRPVDKQTRLVAAPSTAASKCSRSAASIDAFHFHHRAASRLSAHPALT